MALVALTAGCADDRVELSATDPADLEPAAERACTALLDALPETLADQPRRPVDPPDALGAAWGDPAIILRCGGPRPAGFTRASTCLTVNDVDWFIPEEQLDARQELTMTAIHREVYVEVELPVDHWPPATALADLADPVRTSLERRGRCR